MPFSNSCLAEELSFPPPELSNSNSKSSKSSSLHSSTVDDFTGSPDTAQFEEISLENADQILPEELYYKHRKIETASPKVKCNESPHAVFKSLADTRRTSHAVKPPRALQLPKLKHNYPHGRNHLNSVDEKVQASRASSAKKVVGEALQSPTNTASPNLSPTNKGHQSNTRGFPLSNQALARLRTQSSQFRTSSVSFRHRSPHVARKTARELEDEYDDSDEEVPDDAIIWNVPLSPRVEHGDAATNNQLSLSPHIAEISSGYNKPFLNRSLSSSTGDVTQAEQMDGMLVDKQRSLSWANALSSLSVEARDLTQQLEEHTKERECQGRQTVMNGNFVHSPSSRNAAKKPLKVSSVQLPPVRRGDLMIDPLPASKEKEKFLTRTRPSWLPPKNPKEERKHLKEYQKMVVHSAELDRKIAAKVSRDQKRRDNHLKQVCRSWDNDILPRWDIAITEQRTRELWWHGIIPHSRGTVWMRAIGNDLGLSETSFKTALARAKAIEVKAPDLHAIQVHKVKELDWFDTIKRDVSSTWPALNLFQSGRPLFQPTVDLLMAYAVYRNDLGYLSGTNLPAALFELSLSPSESFIALSNLFNRPLPLALFHSQPSSLTHFHEVALKTLQAHLPRLHTHLISLNIPPSSYLDPFLTTMATWRMPVDISARIWDVYVFEGDRALIWAFVGLLAKLEGILYGDTNEILSTLGWSGGELWDVGSEDDFMMEMRSIADCDTT